MKLTLISMSSLVTLLLMTLILGCEPASGGVASQRGEASGVVDAIPPHAGAHVIVRGDLGEVAAPDFMSDDHGLHDAEIDPHDMVMNDVVFEDSRDQSHERERDMSGMMIESDMNIVDPSLMTAELPEVWQLFAGNPVLTSTSSAPSQGFDNVYAPHVMFHQGRWWMWYGGQGADGKDAIFLAWSDDLLSWSKHGGNQPIPIVDHGTSNHVNDPTVVWVDSTFYMYYTEAPLGEEDEVHLATSEDGITWQKRGVVINVGAPGSWESDRVGRPSVIYEEGVYHMWYDGQIYGVARHVGYATSADGMNWTKHPGNPIVMHEGAIDVARVGSGYVMLTEAHGGTRYYTSEDRINWRNHDLLIELSGRDYDLFGQVTPHLVVSDGAVQALFFGGASHSCWCKNRIAVALPVSGPRDLQDCEGCLQGFATCVDACRALGARGGMCVAPHSLDPDVCCECEEGPGCEGCLVGFDTCEEACQASGFNGGVCGAPGSVDPSDCCACN